MNLEDKLKYHVIDSYRKFGNEKICLISGGVAYTGVKVAEEIKKETNFGISILTGLLNLTIDLVERNKEKIK